MSLRARTLDRRDALIGLSALGAWMSCARVEAAVRLRVSHRLVEHAAPRTLILVQLSGGNDGLSTIVPRGDDAYYRARTATAIGVGEALALDDYRGWNPGLAATRELYEQGGVAVVEGVGYPNPIRSHFKSFEIWHAADPRGRACGDGWIGRLCGSAWGEPRNPNAVIHVGAEPPYCLRGVAQAPVAFVNPASYRRAGGERDCEAVERAAEDETASEGREDESSLEYLRRVSRDAQASSREVRAAAARYATPIEYADEPLSRALLDAAALCNGDLGARVISVEVSGFDTHDNQRARHDGLMRTLDRALAALVADLRRSEAGRNAIVLVYSEFGRRVRENGSRGTDHGAAAPLLVLGAGVQGGLHGKHPSLIDLVDGDLAHTTDFRSVYATILERWFAVAHEPILRGKHPTLPFLA